MDRPLRSHLIFGLLLAAGLAPGIAASAPTARAMAQNGQIAWVSQSKIAEAQLRVVGPDDYVFEQDLKGGLPVFSLTHNGKPLPDGQYNYELVLAQALPAELAAALDKSPMHVDGTGLDANLAAQVRDYGANISGTFVILGGALLLPQEGAKPSRQDPRPGAIAKDQVIADDLIVQGSACIGLDCVNNESFGFDTLRLKENNTRIKFQDTSTSAGFPNNVWQLTANDSASGGANKFSIDDVTGSKTPFTVTAGAPTNSVFVGSNGKVGFRNSTPVLDLHMTTTDTPAIRFEQTAGGGFTAQTWDIGANEANFFVRDVTGGSRLPFRVRPGAPTSSIDINAAGYVGIGTASPLYKVDITAGNVSRSALHFSLNNTDTGGYMTSVLDNNFYLSSGAAWDSPAGGWIQKSGDGNAVITGSGATGYSVFTHTGGTVGASFTPVRRLHVDYSGNMGINTGAVAGVPISTASGATLTAGGVWTNSSSRERKDHIRDLSATDAVKTLSALNPVTFNYKVDEQETHVGFIAEDVPQLVATKDRKSLSPMDIVAVLTKVVQEQEQTIALLKADLAGLRATVKDLQGRDAGK